MKYGIQLFTLRKYLKSAEGYRNVFRQCAELGVETVQISPYKAEIIGATEIKKLCDEYGIEVCCTHTSPRRVFGDIERLAEEHLTFGCKSIGIGMMSSAYKKNTDGLKKFADMLNGAQKKLDGFGMHVCYHNHNFECGQCDEGLIYDLLINRTDKNVLFIPDTFWIKAGGFEPQDFLPKLAGRVDTIHLKDYKKTIGIPLFRAPGRGILQFDKIISAAEGAGAQNAVIELDISPSPWASVKYALDYLK